MPVGAVLAEWSLDGDAASGVEDDIDAAFTAGLVTDGRLVDPAAAWGLRHRLSESLRALGVVLGHDVSVPRGCADGGRRRAIEAVGRVAPTP